MRKDTVSMPRLPHPNGRQSCARATTSFHHRPVDDLTLLDHDKQRVTATVDEQHGGVVATLTDGALKFGNVGDRVAVYFLDHVAGPQPRFRRWRARLNICHHDASYSSRH